MADFRDVLHARSLADDEAQRADTDQRLSPDSAIIAALNALRIEVRALALTLDYLSLSDGRTG